MKTVLLALCLAAAFATRAFAQSAATATLRVTVVDPSHAIIVGATITVTGAEAATRAQPVPVAKTEDSGIATLRFKTPITRYALLVLQVALWAFVVHRLSTWWRNERAERRAPGDKVDA